MFWSWLTVWLCPVLPPENMSLLTSSRMATPMLSLVITLFSMTSEPSELAMATWLNSTVSFWTKVNLQKHPQCSINIHEGLFIWSLLYYKHEWWSSHQHRTQLQYGPSHFQTSSLHKLLNSKGVLGYPNTKHKNTNIQTIRNIQWTTYSIKKLTSLSWRTQRSHPRVSSPVQKPVWHEILGRSSRRSHAPLVFPEKRCSTALFPPPAQDKGCHQRSGSGWSLLPLH